MAEEWPGDDFEGADGDDAPEPQGPIGSHEQTDAIRAWAARRGFDPTPRKRIQGEVRGEEGVAAGGDDEPEAEETTGTGSEQGDAIRAWAARRGFDPTPRNRIRNEITRPGGTAEDTTAAGDGLGSQPPEDMQNPGSGTAGTPPEEDK